MQQLVGGSGTDRQIHESWNRVQGTIGAGASEPRFWPHSGNVSNGLSRSTVSLDVDSP